MGNMVDIGGHLTIIGGRGRVSTSQSGLTPGFENKHYVIITHCRPFDSHILYASFFVS